MTHKIRSCQYNTVNYILRRGGKVTDFFVYIGSEYDHLSSQKHSTYQTVWWWRLRFIGLFFRFFFLSSLSQSSIHCVVSIRAFHLQYMKPLIGERLALSPRQMNIQTIILPLIKEYHYVWPIMTPCIFILLSRCSPIAIQHAWVLYILVIIKIRIVITIATMLILSGWIFPLQFSSVIFTRLFLICKY